MLCIDGSLASRTSSRNCLTVVRVLNITASENARNIGLCRTRDGLDVALLVEVDVLCKYLCIRSMSNSDKKAADIDCLFLVGLVVEQKSGK